MKLLMTTDAVGGVWNYTLDLAKGLEKHGVQVSLVCMGPPPSATEKKRLHQISGIKFYHKPYKLEWMEQPWAEVTQAGHWLMELAEQIKPDVVHLNGFVHASLAWRCPVVVVGHSCVYSWFRAVKNSAPPAMWHQYYVKVCEGIRNANVFVAPTAGILAQYQMIYKELPPTQIIYNGIDPAPESFIPKEKIVFSMGRLWDEAKNLKVLLEAADNIDFPVYVAGDIGSATIKTPPNLHLLGQLPKEKIKWWLQRAAVYTLPVKYEPFGLSFLEAASAKCALIGGDIPTLHELWGDAMFYAAPDNPEDIAWGCNTILSDERYRSHLAEKAKQKSLNYTLNRKVQQYNNLYRKVQIKERRLA